MTPNRNALQFLDAVQAFLRRTNRTEKILRLLAFCLGYGLALFLLDALNPLPTILRVFLLIVGIGIVAFQIRSLRQSASTPNVSPAALARTIETRLPFVDNALIHAVQFADTALILPSGSGEFVAREQDRAAHLAAKIPLHKSVDIARFRRVQFLCGVLAICWLGLLIGYARLIRFEIPRYAAVWRDAPPFTRTNFVITPEQVEVASGSNVKVTVRVSGVLPHSLNLVTQTSGNAPQSVVMAEYGAQTYTLTLENLTTDTTFYAQGETGRSQTGSITIAPNSQKGKAQTYADQALKSPSKPKKGTAEQESDAAKSSGDKGTGYGDKQKPLPPKSYRQSTRQAETLSQNAKNAPVSKELGDISRFPSNYRRLLQDYFRADR